MSLHIQLALPFITLKSEYDVELFTTPDVDVILNLYTPGYSSRVVPLLALGMMRRPSPGGETRMMVRRNATSQILDSSATVHVNCVCNKSACKEFIDIGATSV